MKDIKEIIDKEKLIHPDLVDVLDDVSEDELEELLQLDVLVLKKEHLDRIRLPDIEYSKLDTVEGNELHVSDFTELYLDRYNYLREIILDKLKNNNISSIDNLDSGKYSVVGMVRKVKKDKVIVEDSTGRLNLKTDKEFIRDEVVGVTGNVIRNEDEIVMQVDKVVYPDVPLRKKVNKTDMELTGLFVTKVDSRVLDVIENKDLDYVFAIQDSEDLHDLDVSAVVLGENYNEQGNVKTVKDMTRLNLESIKIIIHNGKEVKKVKERMDYSQVEVMLKLLKRRHLNPQRLGRYKDKYLLEEVPDIIHMKGEDTMANYKGVTLISTGEDKGFIIDFHTRDIEEIELN